MGSVAPVNRPTSVMRISASAILDRIASSTGAPRTSIAATISSTELELGQARDKRVHGLPHAGVLCGEPGAGAVGEKGVAVRFARKAEVRPRQKVQARERVGRNLADAFALLLFMDEQSLAESAAGENVHMLLERHLIVARQRAQQGRRGRIHVLGHHGRKARLAEIGQPASAGVRHELGETARFVAVFEEFVADVRIVRVAQIGRLGPKNSAPGRFSRRVLLQKRQHFTGAGDALAQRAMRPDVQP